MILVSYFKCVMDTILCNINEQVLQLYLDEKKG